MFLSPDDLAALTGRKRPSAQIRWLQTYRVPFMLDADGLPKVLRSAVEARLDGSPARHEPRLRLA